LRIAEINGTGTQGDVYTDQASNCNTGNMGIEVLDLSNAANIAGNDANDLFVSLEGGAFAQSDTGALDVRLGNNNAQVGTIGLANDVDLNLQGAGADITFNGEMGTNAHNISVDNGGGGATPQGTANINLNSTTSADAIHIMNVGNTTTMSTINAGGGEDDVMLSTFRNASIIGVAGNDAINAFDLTNATIDGGAGNNFISVDNGQAVDIIGGGAEDAIRVHNSDNVSIDGGFCNDVYDLVNVSNSIVNDVGANADRSTMFIENTANLTINTAGFNDEFDIEGNNTGLVIDAGNAMDEFNISGGGSMTLEGGVSDYQTDTYDVHDFSGTANITVGDGDEVSIHDNVTGNLNLTSTTTATNVQMDFVGEAFSNADGATHYLNRTAIGNNLAIQNTNGGVVTLENFFAATPDNQYSLLTSNHEAYADLKGVSDVEVRDLSDAQYSGKSHGAIDFIGMPAAGDTFTIGSQTFTFAGTGGTAGNTIDITDGTTNSIATIQTYITTILNGAGEVFASVNGTAIEFDAVNANTVYTFNATGANFALAKDANLINGLYDWGMNITTDLYETWGSGDVDVISGDGSMGQIIHGNDGGDELTAVGTNTQLFGGQGNDKLFVQAGGGAANSTLDGGVGGFDVVDFSSHTNSCLLYTSDAADDLTRVLFCACRVFNRQTYLKLSDERSRHME